MKGLCYSKVQGKWNWGRVTFMYYKKKKKKKKRRCLSRFGLEVGIPGGRINFSVNYMILKWFLKWMWARKGWSYVILMKRGDCKFFFFFYVKGICGVTFTCCEIKDFLPKKEKKKFPPCTFGKTELELIRYLTMNCRGGWQALIFLKCTC